MADLEHHGGSSTSDVSTLELNIKTLDSRIYGFHVDKNIAVSAFKEKIASQSGVPVEQQRLIFRGKVLKDDLPLSEYHVENGDTLHLVERRSQPSAESRSNNGEATSSNGNRGQDSNAGQPRNRIGQVSHSMVLGTLNAGEPGGAAAPDFGQVIGAVLNSIGIGSLAGGGIQSGVEASHGNGTEGNDEGSQNQGGRQSVPFQALHGQSASHAMQIPLGPAVAMPTLNMPIPDSMDTLVEFMNRMEVALSQSGNQPNQSPVASDHQPTTQLPRSSRGLPTVEALAIVLRQAQRLLSSHAVSALSRTADRLDQEGGSTDFEVRGQVQTESTQLGVAMQHLGALLLELGRTILTLRMGQSSTESFVNAGPAVYISSSWPNPIMVQPFPLQTSSLFSGLSGSAPNPMVMGPIGAGSVPRNVNIHIHTGASVAPIIPRMGNGARYREGTQGQSTSGTESGDSSQARVLSGSNVVPPGTSVSQTPDSNLHNGNNVTSGSTDQGQSVGVIGDDQKAHRSDVKETDEVNTNTEISISSEGTCDRSSASESEHAESLESTARPNQGNNTGSSSGTPLGLGLGGLQPKKRGKLSKGQSKNTDGASTSAQNQQAREAGQQVLQSLTSLSNRVPTSSGQSPNLSTEILGSVPADSQMDMAEAMSQFLENPAMNGILSGVAQQTEVGSPDAFRNILQQFTQNPAMRNTVNQIAQQIDSQGIGDMISGLGGGGGQGGGIDLSRMMQQMMPIVSQALGGVSNSAPPQVTTPAMERMRSESRSTRVAEVVSDPQIDLRQVVQRLANQSSSSQEIFRSLVDNAVHFVGNGSLHQSVVNELCSEGELVQGFMEMLQRDISRRFQDHTTGS